MSVRDSRQPTDELTPLFSVPERPRLLDEEQLAERLVAECDAVEVPFADAPRPSPCQGTEA